MSENRFRKKMEQKNEIQLRRVINNKEQFRPKAVEAAEAVLKSREKENKATTPETEAEPSLENAENKSEIDPRYSLRAIATYQILGSLLIAPSLFNLYPHVIGSARNTAILVFFTLLYVTGFISGILIYQKKYEGLMAAFLFNMCQSIYIQAGSFMFYSTGLFSVIYKFPASLKFGLLNPSFVLNLSQSGSFVIGFNLVACTAFSLLMSALIEYEKNNEFPEHLF